jgi:hypothetical protein
MTSRRIILWLLIGTIMFLVVCGASYFLRSDGYGVLDYRDGIIRVGFPFVIVERGGQVYREYFSLSAALADLSLALIAAALVFGTGYFAKRAADWEA